MNLTSPWKYVITRVPLCVNSSRFSVNKPWEKNHWIPFYSTFTAVTLLQFKHYQNHRRRKMGIANWVYLSNFLKEIFSMTQWVKTVWNERFHFINKNFFPMNSVVSKWASEWVSGVRQQVNKWQSGPVLSTGFLVILDLSVLESYFMTYTERKWIQVVRATSITKLFSILRFSRQVKRNKYSGNASDATPSSMMNGPTNGKDILHRAALSNLKTRTFVHRKRIKKTFLNKGLQTQT